MASGKLSCQQVEKHLSAYLDGEVKEQLRALIDKHLADCEACNEKLAQWKRIQEAMRSARPVSPPVDLAEQVLAQWERDHLLGGMEKLAAQPRPMVARLIRLTAAAAMLTVVLSAGYLTYYLTHRTKPSAAKLAMDSPVRPAPPVQKDRLSAPQAKPAPSDTEKLTIPPAQAESPQLPQPAAGRGIEVADHANLVSRPSPPAERLKEDTSSKEPSVSIAGAGTAGSEEEARPFDRLSGPKTAPPALLKFDGSSVALYGPGQPRLSRPATTSAPAPRFEFDRFQPRLVITADDVPSWMFLNARLEELLGKLQVTKVTNLTVQQASSLRMEVQVPGRATVDYQPRGLVTCKLLRIRASTLEKLLAGLYDTQFRPHQVTFAGKPVHPDRGILAAGEIDKDRLSRGKGPVQQLLSPPSTGPIDAPAALARRAGRPARRFREKAAAPTLEAKQIADMHRKDMAVIMGLTAPPPQAATSAPAPTTSAPVTSRPSDQWLTVVLYLQDRNENQPAERK